MSIASVGADTELAVGIIGCGALVQEYYTLVLSRVPGMRVRAVADLNAVNARQVAAQTGAAVMEAEALCACCQWVLVTTPPEAHAGLAAQALRAGCQVVVEKPFVTSAAAARELVEIAATANRTLHVAQFRRFFPPTELARDLLASGLIGTVQRLEMFEGGRFNWSTQSGYVGRSLFGGVLFDTGSHTLDQALYATGWDTGIPEITVVEVRRDKAEPSHELDCRFELARGQSQVACRLFLSRAQTLANVIRVYGTGGVIEFDCGYQGGVRMHTGTKWIRLAPQQTMTSPAEAFLAEYREIFSRPSQARTQAGRMVGQIAILERLHQHE